MFNSLSIAKQLEAAGVPREQAEAHVQILSDVFENEIASKRDIQELQAATSRDIKQLDVDLRRDIKEMEISFKRDIHDVEQRVVIKISAIVGAMITFSIALTAALNKLL